MKPQVAIYAGTFDIFTVGHLWVATRAAAIFHEIILAIGVNPTKKCLFSVPERRQMLQISTNHLPGVSVDSYENQYLIDYAKSRSADVIIRGLRGMSDFKTEHELRNFNGKKDPAIDTIFLIPPPELIDISSSYVKSLIGPVSWEEEVRPLVPQPVFTELLKKFGGGNGK